MTTVVPPPPTPPPQALQIPQPMVLIPNPPAIVSQLPLGASLTATVLGQGGAGHIQVQTPQGVLTLQTLFPLPPNASIVLQLQSLAPQLQFQIATINGKPPRQSLRGNSGAPPSGLSSALTGATSGRQSVAGRAQAVRGTAAPGGLGLFQVNLAVGATVVATLVATSSPARVRLQSREPSGGGAKTGPLSTEGTGHRAIPGAPPASRSPVAASNGRAVKTAGLGSATAISEPQHRTRIVGAPGSDRMRSGATAISEPQHGTRIVGAPGPGRTRLGAAAISKPQHGTGIVGAPGSGRTTPGAATIAEPQHGTRIDGTPGSGRTSPGTAVDGPAEGAIPLHGLPGGTQVVIKILSLQPAGSEASAPVTADLSKGTTQTATITGRTEMGQAIVHSPAGTLTLATRTTLPSGSTVTFEVTDTPVPPESGVRAEAQTPRLELLISRHWKALNEAISVLQVAEPLVAQQILNTLVPRPNSQLAANILFFLVALRGGDIRSWLGDGPSRALQRHKPDLLSRLSDEFRTIGRTAEEPVSGDWRIAVVPFNNGEELKQIRIFMRRHGTQEEEEDGDPGTRFIVDVELSRLGRMQLDGLVRGGNKRLDLIVRSTTPLPGHMRDDIRRIFQDACELTGMNGATTFQCTPPDFVEISPDAVAEDHLGLIV